jgi:mannosyltransferase
MRVNRERNLEIRPQNPGLSERIACLGVFLLALVVRLLGIASRSIWYDEAFAILFSAKGPAAMLRGTLTPDVSGAAADIHPLAYYTLLWGWMKVFGESLVSVRLLSILFGLGTLILAYLLLRSMFAKPQLALLGALGLALSPFQVHYSQEIRMYSLLALALTGATLALWQGLHSTQWRWWLLFSFCAALAQYTQNLAAFYLVPLALTPVFLRRWEKVKATVLAGIGALVLYLPWLLQLPAQFAKIEKSYWVERPTLRNIFTTLLSYVTNLPISERWISLALAVTLVVIALAAYQTWLALRDQRPGAKRGLWLAYLAFAPALLMFIVSQWRPVYVERALLPSGVIFWLWLAWALAGAGMPRFLRFINFGLLTAGVLLGLAMHLTYSGFPYGPYAALDTALEARFQSGDVILHSNKLTVLPTLYFAPGLEQRFIADPPGASTDTLAPATQQVLGIEASNTLDVATQGKQRIWFVVFQQSIDEALSAGLPTHPQITWLDAHFQRQNIETWGPIQLYVYTR